MEKFRIINYIITTNNIDATNLASCLYEAFHVIAVIIQWKRAPSSNIKYKITLNLILHAKSICLVFVAMVFIVSTMSANATHVSYSP